MAMKGCSAFPKASASLEPHHQMTPTQRVSWIWHSLGRGLTPLQRSSWCILQPQPTGQTNVCNTGIEKKANKKEKERKVHCRVVFRRVGRNHIIPRRLGRNRAIFRRLGRNRAIFRRLGRNRIGSDPLEGLQLSQGHAKLQETT